MSPLLMRWTPRQITGIFEHLSTRSGQLEPSRLLVLLLFVERQLAILIDQKAELKLCNLHAEGTSLLSIPSRVPRTPSTPHILLSSH